MKKIFKILLPLFFIFIGTVAYGQVTKYRTTSVSIKTKNKSNNQWTKWSEPEKVNVLITVDIENNRIKIFSKKDQIYDIIQYNDKETDDDGDDVLQLLCVNEDGLKCNVRFVVLNSKNGKRQIYIDFADMIWMYNIYKLD